MDEENKPVLVHADLPDSYKYERWEIVLLAVAVVCIAISILIILSI